MVSKSCQGGQEHVHNARCDTNGLDFWLTQKVTGLHWAHFCSLTTSGGLGSPPDRQVPDQHNRAPFALAPSVVPVKSRRCLNRRREAIWCLISARQPTRIKAIETMPRTGQADEENVRWSLKSMTAGVPVRVVVGRLFIKVCWFSFKLPRPPSTPSNLLLPRAPCNRRVEGLEFLLCRGRLS